MTIGIVALSEVSSSVDPSSVGSPEFSSELFSVFLLFPENIPPSPPGLVILRIRIATRIAMIITTATLDIIIIFLSFGSNSSISLSSSSSGVIPSSPYESSSSSSSNRLSNLDGGMIGVISGRSTTLDGVSSTTGASFICLPSLIAFISSDVISTVGEFGTTGGTTTQSMSGFACTRFKSAINALAVKYLRSAFFCVHFKIIFSRLVGISG